MSSVLENVFSKSLEIFYIFFKCNLISYYLPLISIEILKTNIALVPSILLLHTSIIYLYLGVSLYNFIISGWIYVFLVFNRLNMIHEKFLIFQETALIYLIGE